MQGWRGLVSGLQMCTRHAREFACDFRISLTQVYILTEHVKAAQPTLYAK